MPKMLRQLKTGRVYPWTEQLAARADMVEFEEPTAEATADEAAATETTAEAPKAKK
jgi:hypothetical protein